MHQQMSHFFTFDQFAGGEPGQQLDTGWTTEESEFKSQ
jgi:hypothetical protein